jgi:hypothetical protein
LHEELVTGKKETITSKEIDQHVEQLIKTLDIEAIHTTEDAFFIMRVVHEKLIDEFIDEHFHGVMSAFKDIAASKNSEASGTENTGQRYDLKKIVAFINEADFTRQLQNALINSYSAPTPDERWRLQYIIGNMVFDLRRHMNYFDQKKLLTSELLSRNLVRLVRQFISNEFDLEAGLKRIRQAIFERLHKKLADRVTPNGEGVKKDRIAVAESSVNPNFPHLTRIKKLFYPQERGVFRKEKYMNEDAGEVFTEYLHALTTLADLPEHPNIIPVLQYDLEKGVKIVEEVEGVKHVPDGHDLEDEILKAEQEHGYDSDERLRKVINALHVFRDHMVACVYLDEHDLILQDIKLEQMTYVLTPDGKKQGKVLDIEGVYPSGVENSLRLQTPSANMLPNWSNPYAKTCPEEMCYQFGLTFSRFKGTIKSLGNKKSDINLDLLIADMMSCDPSLANADPAAKIYTGISLKKSLKIFEGIIDQLEAPELNQVAKAA